MATQAVLRLLDHEKAESLLAEIPHEVHGFTVTVDAGALDALKPAIDKGWLEVVSTPRGAAKEKGK